MNPEFKFVKPTREYAERAKELFSDRVKTNILREFAPNDESEDAWYNAYVGFRKKVHRLELSVDTIIIQYNNGTTLTIPDVIWCSRANQTDVAEPDFESNLEPTFHLKYVQCEHSPHQIPVGTVNLRARYIQSIEYRAEPLKKV